MKRVFLSITVVVILIVCWIGYRFLVKKPEKVTGPLLLVSSAHLPAFTDDLKGEHLDKALRRQIEKLRKGDLEVKVKFGEMMIARKRILRTLECLQRIVEEKGINALNTEIPKYFQIFQAAGQTRKGDVLFTGYYQPVFDARTRQEGEYRYPLYRVPPDLQMIDLGDINPKYAGEKIALRVDEGKIKPYFDRKAIDKDLALHAKGLEIVYLKDFLDRYMLQVQGSGIMKIENGEEIKVRYAGSNCFPYVSLRELLVDKGALRADQASLKTIRDYFQKKPEAMKEYLFENRRYIFFEKHYGDVRGSEGVDLTAGRSIATDKTIFPGGGLAFVMCQKPVLNAQGEVSAWEPMIRFMVDQDTGAAIKGPGRVDLFWGTGKEAGDIAGSIKKTGKLFYLLINEEQ